MEGGGKERTVTGRLRRQRRRRGLVFGLIFIFDALLVCDPIAISLLHTSLLLLLAIIHAIILLIIIIIIVTAIRIPVRLQRDRGPGVRNNPSRINGAVGIAQKGRETMGELRGDGFAKIISGARS